MSCVTSVSYEGLSSVSYEGLSLNVDTDKEIFYRLFFSSFVQRYFQDNLSSRKRMAQSKVSRSSHQSTEIGSNGESKHPYWKRMRFRKDNGGDTYRGHWDLSGREF